jgi:hypothetical protein
MPADHRPKSTGPLPVHPAAQLLPPLTPEEYQGLKSDMAVKGQQVRILTYRGQTLDGRHRDLICHELGIEPLYEEYTGNDPVGVVLSLNVYRRHLTPEQKRELAAHLLRYDPHKPNLTIAKLTGASDKTVAGVRAELEGRSEIPNVTTRTDSRGRQQPAHKPRPKAEPEDRGDAWEGDDPDCPLPFAGLVPVPEAEPAKVELLNDAYGQPVPDGLVPEAKRHRRLRSIADAVRKAKAQWEFETGPAQADVGRLFDGLIAALANEVKFTVCPACGGLATAGGCEGSASACAGKGWLTAAEFDRLPEQHKRHALRFRTKRAA